MNLFALSWNYIKSRPLNTGLNVLLLGLGTGIIVILLLLSRQVEEKLVNNARKIDLVVGAKGSPMQLILSSIFHIDYPTGNIPLEESTAISKNRYVESAIPLALGDSYKTFRIVGTTHDYPNLYNAKIQEGTLWSALFEVTVGANVANALGLKKGDTFYGQHGMAAGGYAHEEISYAVAGVLTKTNSVIDNLILTNIESIWAMHDHELLEELGEEIFHSSQEKQANVANNQYKITQCVSNQEENMEEEDGLHHISLPLGEDNEAKSKEPLKDQEITSLLITYRSPMAAIHLPRFVNSKSSLQAASPAFETARLFSLLGVGIGMVQGLALIIILIAAISIFVALFNELKQRKYDLAIMRSLGASRQKVFVHVILEGMIITSLGTIVGLLVGHGALELLRMMLPNAEGSGVSITGFIFIKEEYLIIGSSILLGALAALIPAWNAYKTDISKVLAKG